MNTHFLRWRNLLEHVLGATLKPDDHLFPHIAVNGVIRTAREMSYDSLQTLLSKFCEGAGLQKRYTTHSFRRGGAQYRFMYAPVGKRWSLNQIRWWGGWAIGEHVFSFCFPVVKRNDDQNIYTGRYSYQIPG